MPYDDQRVKDAVRVCCERLLLDDTSFGRDDGSAERFVLTCALDELVWKFSEASAINKGGKKYVRCELWSRNAAEAWRRDNKQKLIFEHVVPRWKIITALVNAKDKGSIAKAFEMVTTCVVLPDEDRGALALATKALEKERGGDDLGSSVADWWARYDRAGVERVPNPAVSEIEIAQQPAPAMDHPGDESGDEAEAKE
jgi:hypothetical protein